MVFVDDGEAGGESKDPAAGVKGSGMTDVLAIQPSTIDR